MRSECSGETGPSVLVNDLMCWLIRLQKPVHSRLFEACADPEGGAGARGRLPSTHLFQTSLFLNMLWVPPRIQKGGGQRGSNSGNCFSCCGKREPKYHFKWAIIGPSLKRHLNGVMLAGR